MKSAAMLSEYQSKAIGNALGLSSQSRARWALNRMWELIEAGVSVGAARKQVGHFKRKDILAVAFEGELDAMKRCALEIRADRAPYRFNSQREMESIICWYSRDGYEGEWATPPESRRNQYRQWNSNSLVK